MQGRRFLWLAATLCLSDFVVAATGPDRFQFTREVECLALNIYHEARNEPVEGQFAVGLVTMNRVYSRRYPDTVCSVVYESRYSSRYKRRIAQFSWTLDGKSEVPYETKAWETSIKIAKLVYYTKIEHDLPDVLHYHADYVAPEWADKMEKVAQVGLHIFYRGF